MTHQLTQKLVNSVSANGSKQRFPDSKVSGLTLRVSQGGKKVWAIRYRSAEGASREMKIGDADKMPLEDARKTARLKLANVPTGGDPLRDKRAAKREAVQSKQRTVAAMTDRYRDSSDFLTKRETTRATYNNSLDRHILPRVGKMSLKTLTRGAISSLLDDLATEHSGNVSNQARSALSVVLSFAVERDAISYNPMRGIRAKHKTPVRERILSDVELKGLWEGLRAGTVSDLVKLLLVVPARSNEAAGMMWDELDLETGLWSIPAERMKGAQSHELPLSKTAITLLRRRQESATTPWVFPNKDATAPIHRARPSRFCNRYSKTMGWVSFGPHDLRRTIATRLAKMGLGHATIERTLGHKVGAGKAIVNYDHHDYRDRKRAALESWEAELLRVLHAGDTGGNVFQLRETA